jgi:hypothetical protein
MVPSNQHLLNCNFATKPKGNPMSNAQNAPIRREQPSKVAEDSSIGQNPSLLIDPSRQETIETVGGNTSQDFMSELAFNEEPIQILIHSNQQENASTVVDCWVQGRGAEVLINGEWKTLGYLPLEIPVTTKRKYANVLMRSRVETIRTDVGDSNVENPHNRIVRNARMGHTLQVLQDKSPHASKWFSQITMQAV